MIPLILQDSIDRSLLESFIEMRKEKKKPITQQGIKCLINKLSRLEMQGHCPNLLLERSIINGDKGWQDVYPDDSTKKPVKSNVVSFSEKWSDRSWAEGL